MVPFFHPSRRVPPGRGSRPSPGQGPGNRGPGPGAAQPPGRPGPGAGLRLGGEGRAPGSGRQPPCAPAAALPRAAGLGWTGDPAPGPPGRGRPAHGCPGARHPGGHPPQPGPFRSPGHHQPGWGAPRLLQPVAHHGAGGLPGLGAGAGRRLPGWRQRPGLRAPGHPPPPGLPHPHGAAERRPGDPPGRLPGGRPHRCRPQALVHPVHPEGTGKARHHHGQVPVQRRGAAGEPVHGLRLRHVRPHPGLYLHPGPGGGHLRARGSLREPDRPVGRRPELRPQPGHQVRERPDRGGGRPGTACRPPGTSTGESSSATASTAPAAPSTTWCTTPPRTTTPSGTTNVSA